MPLGTSTSTRLIYLTHIICFGHFRVWGVREKHLRERANISKHVFYFNWRQGEEVRLAPIFFSWLSLMLPVYLTLSKFLFQMKKSKINEE
jgi:hypothetical protein